jgi:hypothetical protein
MTSRIQTLRSSVAGNIPANGVRSPGELWTNFPDKQLGVIDASQNAQKLLAVRIFSTAAAYVTGDMVSQAGAIYAANTNVPAGAFTPSQWNKLASMTDVVGNYLPIAGGTLTGALVLNADPSANLGAATKQYVDGKLTGAFLPISGGTVSGNLTVSGTTALNGVTNMNPATGSISLQPASGNVVIKPSTAGSIDNMAIGGVTPAAGKFTTLTATAAVTFDHLTLNPATNVPALKVGPASAAGQPCVSGDNSGQAYLGANAYFDPGTSKYYVAANSTQGWGLLVITAAGAPCLAWATSGASAGTVTGGAQITPSWNFPLSKGGDTMNGALVCASNLTVSGTTTLNGGTNTQALTTFGGLSIQGGTQYYSAGYNPSGTYPAAGLAEFYNVAIRASTYVGPLGATPNSFAGNPSYIWGSGHWGYSGGGGALFGRADNTNIYMAGWLWGTSSLVGTISTNGSSVSYNTTSDGRLKKNVRDITEEVDIGAVIDGIRPVAFRWKNRRSVIGEPGGVLYSGAKPENPDNLPEPSLMAYERAAKGTDLGHGFIAQELIKIAPIAVHAPDDGEREDFGNFGEPGHTPWGVDAAKLMPYVIAELQALRRRVAELEGQ